MGQGWEDPVAAWSKCSMLPCRLFSGALADGPLLIQSLTGPWYTKVCFTMVSPWHGQHCLELLFPSRPPLAMRLPMIVCARNVTGEFVLCIARSPLPYPLICTRSHIPGIRIYIQFGGSETYPIDLNRAAYLVGFSPKRTYLMSCGISLKRTYSVHCGLKGRPST